MPLPILNSVAATFLALPKWVSGIQVVIEIDTVSHNDLILSLKKKRIYELKSMNDEVERLHQYEISSATSISMITHMMTLMFHLKSLSENDDNTLQLKALDDAMHEYKSKLHPDYVSGYEDNVEIHVNYIKKSTIQ